MAEDAPTPVPDAGRYADALGRLAERLSDVQRSLLVAHYLAPGHAATARELAEAAGLAAWQAVNSQYGQLGTMMRDALGYQAEGQQSYAIASFVSPGTGGGTEWLWVMHPELAEALEQLGWVQPNWLALPDEVQPAAVLVEGATRQVTVNAYERNPRAHRRCIAAHGTDCCICGFNFGAVYGPEAHGYIHVHHIRPLSEIGEDYVVNPVEDLRPVCPNCHAVLHLGGRCRPIEDVRRLLGRG